MRLISTDLWMRRNTSEASRNRKEDGKVRKRLRHPHLPSLYYMAHNRQWPDLLRRCRTHPREIFIQEDITGNTPLHVVCRHDPPVPVVEALIQVCHIRNNDGATPLHIAASYRCSPIVIYTLIAGDNQNNSRNHEEHNGEDQDVYISQLSEDEPTIITRTKMGRTPIHYACMSFRGLHVDAFELLLDATMKAVSKYHNQRINNEDDDTIDLNYEENDPFHALTLQDYTGQTPLALLFRRYRERVRCVIKMVELSTNTNNSNSNSNSSSTTAIQAVQAELSELWEKAKLIVGMMAEQKRLWTQEEKEKNINLSSTSLSWTVSQAELAAAKEAAEWAAKIYHHPQNDASSVPTSSYDDQLSAMTETGRKFRIVHASVGLTGYGCPPEMIKLAISVHPHQVQEMDEDGFLPIHIAAVASSHIIDQCKNNDGKDNKYTSSFFSEEERSLISDDGSDFSKCKWEHKAFDKVIRLLLQRYPLSIRIPHGKSGHLPLILALESKKRTWNDGVQILLQSYPAALESKEWNPKLYPSIFSLLHRSYGDKEEEKLADANEMALSTKTMQRRKRRQKMLSMTTLYDLIRARPNILHRTNG